MAWLLAACSPLPDFDGPKTLAIPPGYPRIEPLEQVLAVGADPKLEETDAAALQARAADLQSRAAALPAEAVDPETRERLENATGGGGG